MYPSGSQASAMADEDAEMEVEKTDGKRFVVKKWCAPLLPGSQPGLTAPPRSPDCAALS